MEAASTMQAFTRSPSRWTVQAPHFPEIAALLRAGQLQLLAQEVEQGDARLDHGALSASVHAKSDFEPIEKFHFAILRNRAGEPPALGRAPISVLNAEEPIKSRHNVELILGRPAAGLARSIVQARNFAIEQAIGQVGLPSAGDSSLYEGGAHTGDQQ
jgi:hypothetical protein